MVGRSGNRGDGGDADMDRSQPFSELTKNPWVVILVAAITGTGSGTFFGRPDPFTGTQGREHAVRIAELERSQAVDDAHRRDATDGYKRMRDTERCCSTMRSDIRHNAERINELRNGWVIK